MFVFAIVVFVFDKFQQGADGGSNRTHSPICLAKRDLCVESSRSHISSVRWSFGRCCVRGRYIRLFLMWADKPLAHYQIVDLEDIVYLLMYRQSICW